MNTQDFFKGLDSQAHHWLGAFSSESGTIFRLWAPRAKSVSVVGDFNEWNSTKGTMIVDEGIWSVQIPNATVGDKYKFAVESESGTVLKSDPFARTMERPPHTASIISDLSNCMNVEGNKVQKQVLNTKAMTIYEMHVGSWKSIDGGRPSFRTMAKPLIEYAHKLNITHLQFMPITHHPFFGSWGYQCLGYFSPLSEYGSTADLCWLLDELHHAGIGCILDWVPAHFPMDEGGFVRFDGESLFEHPNPKRGFHPDWQTAVFDYGRPEVRSFLLSSARFWLEEIGFDGLRVDAVSSMLYLNYSRGDGEWEPNKDGGHEHLEAISFCHDLHHMVKNLKRECFLIAEESTAWPKVSFPPEEGGVGFQYKWDMGWMHDTLKYLSRFPEHRQYHHDELLFRSVYRFHEHFVLALSHDEVVHGKGSLLNKMPGDRWQRFATCRLLFSMMIAQPGKKLIFMGMEFGQELEWNHDAFLQWALLEDSMHLGLRDCYAELNRLYRTEVALQDDTRSGLISTSHRDDHNSVMLLIRYAQGECLVCLFNGTTQAITDYAIGVPMDGKWSETFNSDQTQYGGSGLVAEFTTHSQPQDLHGFAQQIVVGIPPLGASFWKWEGEKDNHA